MIKPVHLGGEKAEIQLRDKRAPTSGVDKTGSLGGGAGTGVQRVSNCQNGRHANPFGLFFVL
ncbi:hypothetical protein AB434_0444 [Heyndrickxia coagulans]|uniref:Uncharacterized protein n=1 Tax=Heyndrickxia coagulans TaxID=1398 RepID=A0AAN0T488_HEYCO|nr:hypothetical protein SB48_HM08orf01126 [Heyndrickxia coagulans]AKN52849.1 hypothetical protein AB434_0444 [Heyndrickxia coagulans]